MTLTERQDVVEHPRHRVFILVDHFDFATIEALHYASGLHAEKLEAVHFVIDALHAARLQERWEHFEDEVPLRMIDVLGSSLESGGERDGPAGDSRSLGHQGDGIVAASDVRTADSAAAA